MVSPVVYDNKLRTYRDGSSAPGVVASSFAGDLNGFLAVKLGAFVGLVICLLVILDWSRKMGYKDSCCRIHIAHGCKRTFTWRSRQQAHGIQYKINDFLDYSATYSTSQ